MIVVKTRRLFEANEPAVMSTMDYHSLLCLMINRLLWFMSIMVYVYVYYGLSYVINYLLWYHLQRSIMVLFSVYFSLIIPVLFIPRYLTGHPSWSDQTIEMTQMNVKNDSIRKLKPGCRASAMAI